LAAAMTKARCLLAAVAVAERARRRRSGCRRARARISLRSCARCRCAQRDDEIVGIERGLDAPRNIGAKLEIDIAPEHGRVDAIVRCFVTQSGRVAMTLDQ